MPKSKTRKSSHKKKHTGGFQKSRHAWAMAIGRSQSCEDACSESLAKLLTELHMTYEQLEEGTLPADDTQGFFALLNVLATARIRCRQISGDNSDALAVIEDSLIAMDKVFQRWNAEQKWHCLEHEAPAIEDGMQVAEAIVRASSYLELQAAFALRQKEIEEASAASKALAS